MIMNLVNVSGNNQNNKKKDVFVLSDDFVNKFKGKQPNWGPLGYFTYKRTYARLIEEENRTEEFYETLKRVVNGIFTYQKRHCLQNNYPWDENKAMRSAKEMYQRMWDFKFLPPGRGLWAVGTDFVETKGGAACNNCGFVSTEKIGDEGSKAFRWTMDMLMLGVGIGFDTQGAEKFTVVDAKKTDQVYVIPDTREGWVVALGLVIDPFIFDQDKLIEVYKNRLQYDPLYENVPIFEGVPNFDFSLIRKQGEPIKGFGGKASGPQPLIELLNNVYKILRERVGHSIRSIDILDIVTNIAACVIAGNVRRSATLSLGGLNDYEYLDAKNFEVMKNQPTHRQSRWGSNNSVFVKIGDDYKEIVKRIVINGEPGLFWLENARQYSRMCEPPNNLDYRIAGCNPCAEQSLESYELCVRGDTRIQTKHGCFKIKDLKDQIVEVWNGSEWSKTTVQLTSPKSKLVRVSFSDGSYLDCTEYHEFRVREKDASDFIKKKASELKENDELPRWKLDTDYDGKLSISAYDLGLMAGYFCLKEINDTLIKSNKNTRVADMRKKIESAVCKKQYVKKNGEKIAKCSVQQILPTREHNEMYNDPTAGILDQIFQWSKLTILKFVAGWVDSTELVLNQDSTDIYYMFGSEQKVRDLQILLRRININHAKIYRAINKKNGIESNSSNIWTCEIPIYESKELIPLLKLAPHYSSNDINIKNSLTNKQNQTVVNVESLNIEEPVYCFNEPIKHMGVFGNVLTHQCCLVEVFPNKHDSYDDFRKTLKLAYQYAKTITLLKTSWADTNIVMDRNRRIGTSLSGLMNAHARLGRKTVLDWAKKGYSYITDLDARYSDDWLGVHRSIKRCTIKPSGTTSLLPGESPGIHYPHSEYYIRRIRVDFDSPLIEILKESGYTVYPDKTSAIYKEDEDGNRVIDYYTTMIVMFPVHEKNFTCGKSDVSVWKQLSNVIDYQKYWSDNQVSVTITFKKEEENELEDVIMFAEDKVKSLSFLPLYDHGYQDAPYEAITREEYEKMSSVLKPLDFSNVRLDGVREDFCTVDGKCNLQL